MKILSLLIVTAFLANAQQSCGPRPYGRIQPSVASGYQVQVVATGLASPRGIALDAEANLLVVERDRGLISAHTLTEEDGCVSVKSSKDVTPALDLNHGIEISSDGSTLFASSSSTAYSWRYNARALSATDRQELVVNMDGSGHTTRTLLLSRSVPGMIVISRGSVENLDLQAASVGSGIAQVKAFDLTNLTGSYDYNEDGLRLGWGLRNEVGIAEHPVSGAIYGVENSADEIYRYNVDVHEDNPAEELNLLGFLANSSSLGSNFGYPWCFSAWQVQDLPNNGNLSVGSQFAINPSQDLDNENRTDAYCAEQTAPRLVFQAHMAPLDIKFNHTGRQAWITFHGSWDRTDPVGYKLSVVSFDRNGEPVEPVASLTAARDILANQDVSKCPDQCFRPVSLAIDDKGRIFMSSDSSGEIYLISPQSGADKSAAASLYSSQVTTYTLTGFLEVELRRVMTYKIDVFTANLSQNLHPSPPNWSTADDSDPDYEPVKSTGRKSTTGRKSLAGRKSSSRHKSQDLSAPKSRKTTRTKAARVKRLKAKPHAKVKAISPLRCLAPFEKAPAEVHQMIATLARSDRDIASMALVSKTIAHSILPPHSPIWRTRFLARYDYPVIPSPGDFCLAYKLRRFVLDASSFVAFEDSSDQRLPIQMEVIKDLVLETYHNPAPWRTRPQSSKNIHRIGSSPWVPIFLSSPFYGFNVVKFGHGNALFEALQLTLSHLILSPQSRVASKVQTSRDHYDITRVYGYNCRSPTTLFTRLPECEPGGIEYALDLNTLLHVRNFWHRHLIDGSKVNVDKLDFGENSYAPMAKALMQLGYTPKAWTAPLQDPLGNLEAMKNGVWHGHYTGLQPWPKDDGDLEEQQTMAEDWDQVAPLRLDFAAHTDNSSSTWPWIFSSIPAFESTAPTMSNEPTFYLRGIAPFINLEELERRQQSASTSKLPRSKSASPSIYLDHPFISLRLRGIAHRIPDSLTPIPGFYRVILVLFRPRTQHMISDGLPLDPVEREKVLLAHLKAKLKTSVSTLDGSLAYAEDTMTRQRICQLEDLYSGALDGQLDWSDIGYAYAYEGVIVPGGRLMLGKWWRAGETGSGPLQELDRDGFPLDDDDDEEEEEEVDEEGDRPERGAFCFWA
ncbi:hypothetical protein DV735_g1239, partial [Chaetothyriales sp. CBS 134920]